jgi:hypothetical protein
MCNRCEKNCKSVLAGSDFHGDNRPSAWFYRAGPTACVTSVVTGEWRWRMHRINDVRDARRWVKRQLRFIVPLVTSHHIYFPGAFERWCAAHRTCGSDLWIMWSRGFVSPPWSFYGRSTRPPCCFEYHGSACIFFYFGWLKGTWSGCVAVEGSRCGTVQMGTARFLCTNPYYYNYYILQISEKTPRTDANPYACCVHTVV